MKLEYLIDIKEESVTTGDIDDEVIIEMVKTAHEDVDCFDSEEVETIENKEEISLEDINNAIVKINDAIIILRNDDEADKSIFKDLSKIQNYLYKKTRLSKNGSLLKWLLTKINNDSIYSFFFVYTLV